MLIVQVAWYINIISLNDVMDRH